MESPRANIPELVPESVTLDDVFATDKDLLTLDNGPLTDEDIVADFTTDNVEQEDAGVEIEMVEEWPMRPAANEARQAVDALATYSLFVEKGFEEFFVLPMS